AAAAAQFARECGGIPLMIAGHSAASSTVAIPPHVLAPLVSDLSASAGAAEPSNAATAASAASAAAMDPSMAAAEVAAHSSEATMELRLSQSADDAPLPCLMLQLPDEMLLHVFSFLDRVSAASLARTCRLLNVLGVESFRLAQLPRTADGRVDFEAI